MYSISLLITGGLNLFSLTWHSDVEFENYSCMMYVDMLILVSPMSEDAVYIVVKLCNARDPLIWSLWSGWYKCFPHFLGLLGVEWWTLKNFRVMEFFFKVQHSPSNYPKMREALKSTWQNDHFKGSLALHNLTTIWIVSSLLGDIKIHIHYTWIKISN